MNIRILNIGIFGRPNAGKSSLLNFLTGTQTAIVSDAPGTTTDSVSKRMEVPGAGICNFIDTAGLADGSSLSALKDEKTISRIPSLDAALLLIPYGSSVRPSDSYICSLFKENNIPFLVLLSKFDALNFNECNGAANITHTSICKSEACEFDAGDMNKKGTQKYQLPAREDLSCKTYIADIRRMFSLEKKQVEECSIKDTGIKDHIFEFLIEVAQHSAEYEERPMFEGLSGGEVNQEHPETCNGTNGSCSKRIPLVGKGSRVVLVCPVDSGAPEGRLILPQVMAIRQLLDLGAIVTVLQPEQLPAFIDDHSARTCIHGHIGSASHRISLVVTDSQVFSKVAPFVPADVPLTSFSILLARAKGPFEDYLAGMRFLESLDIKTKDCVDSQNIGFSCFEHGNSCGEKQQSESFSGTFRVLVLESCTHHATCEDIGRVKIPADLTKYIKSHCSGVTDVQFSFVSSNDEIPSSVPFNLAVQCGGCVVTKRQLVSRLSVLRQRGIPLVNYGMCLALCAGIWKRAGAVFK